MTEPIQVKEMPDGRALFVYRMIFNARLCLGDPEASFYDDFWCYATPEMAVAAGEAWDGEGEPEGWHRSGKSNMRAYECQCGARVEHGADEWPIRCGSCGRSKQ